MDPGELLLVALTAMGLAMDCFAISLCRGMAAAKSRVQGAFLIAASFGGFQAAMTLAGNYAGAMLMGSVSGLDHWLAFILLVCVGLKLLADSREEKKDCARDTTLPMLLALSVATSIDAFAVGLSFAFLTVDIFAAALVIGLASFLLSLLGFLAGCFAGKACGGRAEALGGLMLIGIGIKVLLEHLD